MQYIKKTLIKTNSKRTKLQNTILSINDLNSTKNQITAFTCRDSLFRDVKFRFKPKPKIDHILLESYKNKPIKFSDLCTLLVQYIQTHGLFIENGIVRCDDFLKSITHCDEASFFTILKNIGQIIV